MADTDLSDVIQTAAQKPARVSQDGTSVEGQPLRDLIEADKHVKRNKVKANPFNAIARTQGTSTPSI